MLPLLDYNDVGWDNCNNYEKQKIESVQIEAARIITGATINSVAFKNFIKIGKIYNNPRF
jgi:hypothetical protein